MRCREQLAAESERPTRIQHVAEKKADGVAGEIRRNIVHAEQPFQCVDNGEARQSVYAANDDESDGRR